MSDPLRPWVPDPRLSDVPTNTLRMRQDRPVTHHLAGAGVDRDPARGDRQPHRPGVQPRRAGHHPGHLPGGRRPDSRARRRDEGPELRPRRWEPDPGCAGWNFLDNKPVLVHEMGHIWQFQTRGTSYVTDSVFHNASGQIATGDRNVAYMNYRLRPDSNISDFTAEEQATIIGDYYEMTRIYQNASPPPAWVTVRRPDLPIYERLIQQVRSTSPRPDTVIYQESLDEPAAALGQHAGSVRHATAPGDAVDPDPVPRAVRRPRPGGGMPDRDHLPSGSGFPSLLVGHSPERLHDQRRDRVGGVVRGEAPRAFGLRDAAERDDQRVAVQLVDRLQQHAVAVDVQLRRRPQRVEGEGRP